MSQRYQILKSILIDVEDYIHQGLSIDEVENILTNTINDKHKNCYWRPVDFMLVYRIDTLYNDDTDLVILANNISTALETNLINKKMQNVEFN